MTQYCYVSSRKKNSVSKSLSVEELDLRDDGNTASSVEELVTIVLNGELLDRVIYVGSLLDPKLLEGLIQFLRENQDVFIWFHKDISLLGLCLQTNEFMHKTL